MKHSLASILFLVIPACGDDGGKATPDAPDHQQVDAPKDIDAAPTTGTATLVLSGAGAAGSGALVEWYDATGAVTADNTTDANGMATATVGANATVTLAIGNTLYTTLGVQPGDTITLAVAPGATAVGTINITAPITAGATSYQAQLGGDSHISTINAVTPTAFTLDSKGVDSGKYDALALALDNTGATVGYAADFGLDVPANTTPVAHQMSAFKTDLQSVTFSVTGAPATAGKASLALTPVHGALQFSLPNQSKTFDVNHTATGTIKVPNVPFTNFIYAAQVQSTDQKSFTGHATGTATFAATQSVDYGNFLPMLHGIAVTQTTGIHAAATADGAVTGAIGTLLTFDYAKTGGTVTQIVAGPASATVDLPALGTALAAFAPSAPFTASNPQIILIGGDAVWTDAKDFRQNWFEFTSVNSKAGTLAGTFLVSSNFP